MKEKEQKIKEAWGLLLDNTNSDGWFWFGYACNGWDDVIDMLIENNLPTDYDYYEHKYQELDNGELIGVMFRPKSLQGIENNNGWIKIESEDDLPKEGELFWVKKIGYDYPLFEPMYHDDGEYWLQWYTHYQPIEKPKPPIY